MPMSATMVGALLGLGTQMYSNALRKLPYMRHPWEHVLGIGLGVLFTTQLVKWDAKLQVDLDIMLAKAKAANESRYFGELHVDENTKKTPNQTPNWPIFGSRFDAVSNHSRGFPNTAWAWAYMAWFSQNRRQRLKKMMTEVFLVQRVRAKAVQS